MLVGIILYGKHHSDETKKKMSEAQIGEKNHYFGKKHSDETREKMRKSQMGKHGYWTGKKHSDATKKRMSESRKGEKSYYYGMSLPEETRRKISEEKQGKQHSEEHRMKIAESYYGGFWYGNVRYNSNGKKYCELWTDELKERIRAYWNYRSILSGKTAEDNNGKRLSCHHVYYQEKACCEWDEDAQGYFAWINIGTLKKPDMYKYYVRGDPNKFVVLTHPEHSETRQNRLGWIKLFEGLIEKRGGKCYFSKEEFGSITSPSLS